MSISSFQSQDAPSLVPTRPSALACVCAAALAQALKAALTPTTSPAKRVCVAAKVKSSKAWRQWLA